MVALQVELGPPLEGVPEAEAVGEDAGTLPEDVEKVRPDPQQGHSQGEEGRDREEAYPGRVDTSQDQKRDVLQSEWKDRERERATYVQCQAKTAFLRIDKSSIQFGCNLISSGP